MTSFIAGMFGSSPVQPLEQHADIVHKCARLLVRFFDQASNGDWDGATETRSDIGRLENEADEVKKQIRMQLPRSLFMPVPREDLLELLLVQDKIANRSKDVSGIVIGRRLAIPEPIQTIFLRFVDRCVDATKQARKSVRELHELYNAGFRGAEAELIGQMVEKLDEIETDTDDLEVEVRSALFEIEADLNPVDVMFLYQTITKIGEIADMAERVGRRLELLLAH